MQNHSLITDLYQLTMAQCHWQLGRHNKQAVFHLNFRRHPFSNGYIIVCGVKEIIEIIENYKFEQNDLNYLANLKTKNKQNIFSKEFLSFLKTFAFNCSIYSFIEGTIAFASEPVMRIKGTLLECQLLESILLNTINFQSLIATKASRIFNAAKGKPILEFGLRRAQGKDGALAASRAAYIGGCSATSNVLAGKTYAIPVVGTHSHSWVMSFDSEKEAFKQYVLTAPQNCSLLIDTYSATQGITNAICVVKKYLTNAKNNFFAVRIDSGDITYFSKIIRQKLDQAGFINTKIIASNALDEYIITSLNEQDAKIDIWAVGTKLVTAKDDSAMNGVYKLSAIKEKNWNYCIKISEDIEKINDPGILQVARLYKKNSSPLKQNLFIGDVIFNELTFNLSQEDIVMINPVNPLQQKTFSQKTISQLLLKEVMKNGKICYNFPSIHETRQYVLSQLNQLDHSIKRLFNPHTYHVGLEKSLFDLKKQLISAKKNQHNS